MNALDLFIGQWNSSVTVTQADGSTISYETTNEFKYLAGKEFVEDRAVSVDGNGGHIGIWQIQNEQYRSTYFVSPGSQRIEFVYDWDEDKKILSAETTLPDGSVMKAVDCFLDDSHYTWEITHLSKEGEVLLKMKGLQTRVTS